MKINRTEMRRALAALHPNDQVFEVRLMGQDGKYRINEAGYFRDHERAVAAVAAKKTIATAIYVTLNPVPDELLARADHRLKRGREVVMTSDADVARRKAILIDIDPVRPKGVSSTDEELAAAWERGVLSVAPFLFEHGWPEPTVAVSGNGVHLVYATDLPGPDDIVPALLTSLAQRFSDDHCDIDTTVGNPSRIVKLWGTEARKGDEVGPRRYRLSQVLYLPESVVPVTRRQIESIIEALPSEGAGPRPRPCGARSATTAGGLPDATADFELVKRECGFIRHYSENAAAASEPQWHVVLSIASLCEGRDDLIHEVSRGHPLYAPEETQRKALATLRDGGKPFPCEVIRETRGGERFCAECPHAGKVKSPIVLGRRHGPDKLKAIVSQALDEEDPAGVFAPRVLGALAQLQSRHPATWSDVRELLKNRRITGKVEEALKRWRQQQAADQVPGEARIGLLGDESFRPASPRGYRVTDKGIFRFETKGNSDMPVVTQVAPAPIAVIGRGTRLQDGEEWLTLEYLRARRKVRLEIPRLQAMDRRALVALSARGAPVTSENASDVVEYLVTQEALDLERMPETLLSTQNGWIEYGSNHGFLSGGRAVGGVDAVFRDLDAGTELAEGLRSRGTLDGWKKALAPLGQFPVVRLAVTTALAGPVVRLLGVENLGLELACETSRGKSSAQHAGTSVHGHPSQAMWSWNATGVGIERLAAALNDHTLILDDTKNAASLERLKQIIYMLNGGTGRVRGSKQGMQHVPRWRGAFLTSGETPIWTMLRDAGLRSRLLVVTDAPFGEESDATRQLIAEMNAALDSEHGTALPAFVGFLISKSKQWAKLRAAHKRQTERYARAATTNVGHRLASFAAVLWVTAKAASQAGVLPWSFSDPLPDELWQKVLTEAEGSGDPYLAAWEMMWSWISVNHANFADKEFAPRPLYGRDREADSFVAVFPHLVDQELERAGYTPTEVLRVWRKRGWLETDDARLTKNVRVVPKSPPRKTYCLVRSTEDDGETTEAGENAPGNEKKQANQADGGGVPGVPGVPGKREHPEVKEAETATKPRSFLASNLRPPRTKREQGT